VLGFGPVAFCHGTPRDDNEVVLVEVWTVVCGHTHMPFARLVDRRLVDRRLRPPRRPRICAAHNAN
jgi:hypothetical protein